MSTIFRITGTGRTMFVLSNDGSSLAVTDFYSGSSAIRIYDVHPTRAWCWAIGVALGSACVWQFGVVGAWRAYHKRRNSQVSRAA